MYEKFARSTIVQMHLLRLKIVKLDIILKFVALKGAFKSSMTFVVWNISNGKKLQKDPLEMK